jgi:thymidylate synthase (FAD)
MTFLVVAPIFALRHFQRHRIGWSYNEESARYRRLDAVFYIPAADRNLVQRGKPGKYEFAEGTELQHGVVERAMSDAYHSCYEKYELMLRNGVAREVARAVLPVGIYSSMYATCNARSLMHFLSLRTRNDRALVASFPQREIEMVAEQMEDLWAKLMPITCQAYNENGRVAP